VRERRRRTAMPREARGVPRALTYSLKPAT
jgi:hypothetical protein